MKLQEFYRMYRKIQLLILRKMSFDKNTSYCSWNQGVKNYYNKQDNNLILIQKKTYPKEYVCSFSIPDYIP